ncbi:hypothetical protein [Natrinema sp. 1APR25-10V2]|uniref:hypothetical protein n=1 Tax=Natrinema sp. 1APR25-10V2 TaxID=2951081 RepID=UPI0028762359|nr:hypothetical protein [Natrinema sp. 1APR25-10V2]MDS0474131.1 hypothetical protein [Natrinema sp. 1APR25-10V2]
MPSLDLRSFVARAAAMVDASPPADLGDTRTWLVEPFLETLGWDLADVCVTDRSVDGTHLEYVPTIESVPALFVAVESYDDSLDESRANALRAAMAWTGVDRAIYTNGRQYLLLSGTTDVDYHALSVAELADADSVVADHSRAACERRLEHHARDHVARQLAVERPALVESIVDRLADATVQGDVYADELESATDRFLDRLVVAFADDEREPARADDSDDVSIRFDESTITDDGGSTVADREWTTRSERAGERTRIGDGTDTDSDATERTDGADASADAESGATNGNESDATTATESDATTATDDRGVDDGPQPTTDARGDDPSRAPPISDDEGGDGEYVVRFFNDRGSIGAVGHSTSAGALVQAADYLLERGLAGVEVPWSPDDAEKTVLNAEPVHADGSSMAQPKQLSNGLYLATAGSVEERAGRIEALAARAGLRAMLTGDWE